jgi:hypothetical protein
MTSTETGWGFRRENQNFVASTLQLRSLQQVPGIKRTETGSRNKNTFECEVIGGDDRQAGAATAADGPAVSEWKYLQLTEIKYPISLLTLVRVSEPPVRACLGACTAEGTPRRLRRKQHF